MFRFSQQVRNLGMLAVSWLDGQVAEIRSDPALRVFGALIAVTQAITAHFWITAGLAAILSSEFPAICWPGLDFCFDIDRLPRSQMDLILRLYGSVSVLIAFLFLTPPAVWIAWAGLSCLLALKFAIMALDIRTAMSPQYIMFFLGFAFLFLPRKRSGIIASLVVIYFTAGLLKLNQDWLSGDNLSRLPEYLSVFPIKFLTYYVVILELVLIWYLLSRRGWRFWLVWLQLLVFQAVAIGFIGYYFPAIMLLLISFFAIDRLAMRPKFKSRFGDQWSQIVWIIFGVIFAIFQVLPNLLSREPVYNGVGKYFAMHMFDSVMQCEPKLSFRADGGESKEVSFFPLVEARVGQRLMCNPISFYWRARSACINGLDDGTKLTDFDLIVDIKKRTDESFRPLIRVENFCAKKLRYHVFGGNDWILID